MELRKFLSHEDFRFTEEKLAKLEQLADLVLDWNEKINVTAIKDRDEFIRKNIIDSLCLGHVEEFRKAEKILDIGTGGGFPGMPLAVVFPEKQFYLNDTIGKKLKVVADCAEKLGCKNVQVVHARAEDLAKDKKFRGSFDVVTSRAVANMSTLSEYCIPFVKTGGYFLAFKTNDSLGEVDAAEKAFRLLKAEKVCVLPDGIEGSGHNFIVIKKTGETPAKYPRKAGTPSKEPL